jgi:hypothetical protein
LNLRQAVLLRAAAQSHPIGAGRVDFARDHPRQARDYSRLGRQAQAAAAAATVLSGTRSKPVVAHFPAERAFKYHGRAPPGRLQLKCGFQFLTRIHGHFH